MCNNVYKVAKSSTFVIYFESIINNIYQLHIPNTKCMH